MSVVILYDSIIVSSTVADLKLFIYYNFFSLYSEKLNALDLPININKCFRLSQDAMSCVGLLKFKIDLKLVESIK